MSEQIICAQPRVSTAVSFLMMAFLLDILVTPMESTIVTTATRPSGIAATARLTAIINVSRKTAPVMSPARIRLTPKITTHIASTRTVRIFDS